MEFVQPSAEEDAIVDALCARLDAEIQTYKFTRTAVIRFLRGRKGDVEKAYRALERHVQWRMESNVDNISIESIQTELEKNKVVVAGVDKAGRPLITIYSRRHRKDDRDLEQLRLFIIYSLERALSQSRPEEEKLTILFDLSGFGLYCMDYDVVKVLIDVMQYNYPETLSVAMIVNAPFVFSACWLVIKPWLDPITVGKVAFLSMKQLSEYINPEDIPADLGK